MKLTNFGNPLDVIYLKKCAAKEMRFKGIIKCSQDKYIEKFPPKAD
jgi:hypothetical protein